MKYFTPTIEELLHYGQEYEFYAKDPNKWVKSILTTEDTLDTICLSVFVDDIKKKEIRLKHLNEEDLKELGFNKIGDIKYYNNKIVVVIYPHNRVWIVYQSTNEVDGRVVFKGTIKSKSQLERILKLII